VSSNTNNRTSQEHIWQGFPFVKKLHKFGGRCDIATLIKGDDVGINVVLFEGVDTVAEELLLVGQIRRGGLECRNLLGMGVCLGAQGNDVVLHRVEGHARANFEASEFRDLFLGSKRRRDSSVAGTVSRAVEVVGDDVGRVMVTTNGSKAWRHGGMELLEEKKGKKEIKIEMLQREQSRSCELKLDVCEDCRNVRYCVLLHFDENSLKSCFPLLSCGSCHFPSRPTVRSQLDVNFFLKYLEH